MKIKTQGKEITNEEIKRQIQEGNNEWRKR
jgi:hypothetical protein